METVWDFIFGGSKITSDGYYSHEIKRHLLLGRKTITNLDSILKSRGNTLMTKVRLRKAMVFPVVMYGCESWTMKIADCWRIDASPMDWSMPGLPVHHQLPGLAHTHIHWVVMPSSHLILCRPLLHLPSVFPSIRWPKYWSFSFSISPSSEYSGLISFSMDWLDFLAVQEGTLKSLLQHHSSKALVLWCSVFFIVQLISIHDYRKNHSFD